MAGRRMGSANVKPVGEWRVGERVVCPKCGREGKVGVTTFRAKGREYTYWVVNHPDARKCIIGKVPTAKPEAKVTPVTAFAQAPAEEAPAQVPVEEEVKPVERAVEVPIYREWGPIPEGVDKAAWYSTKIAASWGSVRENPTEENFNRFANTARKIAAQTGVPVEDAITAVAAYVKAASEAKSEREREQAKIRANEAVKFVIARIMVASTAQIETFAEEARARIEEAVRKIEEVSKVPEVKITSEEARAMYAVFRVKKKVAEEVRERAYRKWEEVFSPGRKVVSVEGRPA
jgi:hypothetical protein